jgi:hypothetical protein
MVAAADAPAVERDAVASSAIVLGVAVTLPPVG